MRLNHRTRGRDPLEYEGDRKDMRSERWRERISFTATWQVEGARRLNYTGGLLHKLRETLLSRHALYPMSGPSPLVNTQYTAHILGIVGRVYRTLAPPSLDDTSYKPTKCSPFVTAVALCSATSSSRRCCVPPLPYATHVPCRFSPMFPPGGRGGRTSCSLHLHQIGPSSQ